MVIIAWHKPDFGIIFAKKKQKWCQNQELIPTFNYHNAAPMVLFCFASLVAARPKGVRFTTANVTLVTLVAATSVAVRV